MLPGAMAMGETAKEVTARWKHRVAAAMPAAAALTVAATAAHADPTGVASRAVGQAEVTQQLQSNVRLQRLMQRVRPKHCDARQGVA
jgi:hypothetical protein